MARPETTRRTCSISRRWHRERCARIANGEAGEATLDIAASGGTASSSPQAPGATNWPPPSNSSKARRLAERHRDERDRAGSPLRLRHEAEAELDLERSAPVAACARQRHLDRHLFLCFGELAEPRRDRCAFTADAPG